jgi:Domain of unknown function (DUF4173)
MIFSFIASIFPLAVLAALAYTAYYVFRANTNDQLQYPRPLIASIILAIFALNVFGYTSHIGFGMGAFCMFLFIAILYSTPAKERSWLQYYVTVTGSVTALFFAFRANDFVQNVNGTVVPLLLLLALVLHSTKRFEWYIGWILQTIWQYALRLLRQGPLLLRNMFNGKIAQHSGVFTAIKTLVLTCIVVAFFGTLLAQADPVFAHLVQDIFDELFGRTILSIVVAVFLFATLTVRLPVLAGKAPKLQFLHIAEATVPIAALVGIFAVFLAIQSRYLFGSHADFSMLNITYSDYVRKGFTELLVVTFFGGVLTYGISLKSKALAAGTTRIVLTTLNTVLVLELGLVLASALKRNAMYMETYGITRVRIIGILFLVWLAILLVQLLWFAVRKQAKEVHVLIGTLVSSTVLLVVLNIWNIDARIANAVPPRNEPIDVVYIAGLSADATTGWQTVVQTAQAEYNRLRTLATFTETDKKSLANIKLAMALLLTERDVYTDAMSPHYDWKNYNYSTAKAVDFFHDHQNTSRIECVFREASDLQYAKKISTYDYEYSRLYEYEYPFLDMNISYYPTDAVSAEVATTEENTEPLYIQTGYYGALGMQPNGTPEQCL